MNEMRWVLRIVLIFAVAGVAAGCAAKTGWRKPGGNAGEARAALAECRARANVEVEDRYGRDVNGDGRGGVGQDFRTSMARNEAINMLDRAVAECMAGKGYLR